MVVKASRIGRRCTLDASFPLTLVAHDSLGEYSKGLCACSLTDKVFYPHGCTE